MKAPCKIGTPLVKVEFNEDLGYYVKPHAFKVEDTEDYGKTMFASMKEAHSRIKELREKMRSEDDK